MTTADNVISRLAELNPVPHLGPSGPEEAAEAERVLQRVLASPQRRRVPSSTAGARALTAALTAVAIAVAVGALILLGHHQRASAPLTGGSSRQQLIQSFGVLRTPPTAADRRLGKCIERVAPNLARARAPLGAANILRCGGGLPGGFLIAPGRRPGESAQYLEPSLARGWEPQLLRTVTLPRWGDVVTLMPLSWESSTSHHRTEGLVVSVSRRGRPSALGATGPTSVSWLQDHGVAMSTYEANQLNQNVIVVPDGVARVTLGSFRVLGGASFPVLRGVARASASVHDNVAAIQLKTATVRTPAIPTGAIVEDGIADATWYDASGKVMAHTTTALSIVVKFVHTGRDASLARRISAAERQIMERAAAKRQRKRTSPR